jgi:peptidoglycan-associated lipoprotein
MNVTNTKTCLSLLVLTALLGACSSTPIAPTPAPKAVAAASTAAPAPMTPNRTASGSAGTSAATAAPASQVAAVSTPAYLDPKSDIATGRSVYFNFDDALLKSEFSSLVERHGKYLLANPKLAIRIEGNTDERGSAEYNLALGQKRAEAVRQALKVLGVKDAQMEAVSWGEEKPKAKGHDESDWAQNRRADLQYPSK